MPNYSNEVNSVGLLYVNTGFYESDPGADTVVTFANKTNQNIDRLTDIILALQQRVASLEARLEE